MTQSLKLAQLDTHYNHLTGLIVHELLQLPAAHDNHSHLTQISLISQ